MEGLDFLGAIVAGGVAAIVIPIAVLIWLGRTYLR